MLITLTIVAGVALALLAVAGAVAIDRAAEVRSLRAQAREAERQARLRESREDLLLDRLAHAYDKPWVEPPADEVAEEKEEEDDPLADTFVTEATYERGEPVEAGGSF